MHRIQSAGWHICVYKYLLSFLFLPTRVLQVSWVQNGHPDLSTKHRHDSTTTLPWMTSPSPTVNRTPLCRSTTCPPSSSTPFVFIFTLDWGVGREEGPSPGRRVWEGETKKAVNTEGKKVGGRRDGECRQKSGY